MSSLGRWNDGPPIPYQLKYKRVRSATEPPKSQQDTSTPNPRVFHKKLQHGTIPVSVSGDPQDYSTKMTTNAATKTITCFVYRKDDDQALQSAENETLRMELDYLKKEVAEIKQREEDRIKMLLEYELTCRTLLALDTFLYNQFDVGLQNRLEDLGLTDMVAIRYEQNRRARVTPASRAAHEAWAHAVVVPYHDIYTLLRTRKRVSSVVRNRVAHATPTRAEFMKFMEELPLQISSQTCEQLVMQEHYVEGDSIPLFFS